MIPKLPEIDAARVTLNADGFAWRSFFIRLPAAATADDLKRPELFRRVQASRISLRKFDELRIVAYDESWLADAIVERADDQGVTLSKPRITQFSGRVQALFSDGRYRVEWLGTGFGVVRIADGHQMLDGTVANEALAINALRGLYPKKVA